MKHLEERLRLMQFNDVAGDDSDQVGKAAGMDQEAYRVSHQQQTFSNFHNHMLS